VLNAPGKTPSAGAKSANYVKSQGNAATTIFDGRGAKGKPPTIGPPIHIFHPIFSDFARLVDSSDIPTYEDLTSVLELMRFASEVHRPEDNYGDGLRRHLTRILRITIHQDPNPDGSRPDGIISAELDGDKFPFVFIELKREIGEGGCDPTTQAGVSMRRSWIHSSVGYNCIIYLEPRVTPEQRARLRDKCCCPTFLIAAGGAWLSVLGGVFTDKFIVQRLTSMRWIGISSTAEFNRVYHNAKVLIALRKCIQTLRSYYESDSKTDPLGTSHPRFFPHPTSFTAGDGTSTSFRYLKALENYPSCVTYLAEIIDQSGATDTRDKVVVKFVMRYGEQVHKFLAEHGRAPTLRYYGPLPKHTLFDRFLGHTENITLGPHFEPNIMNMVVMDYIQATPRPKLPQNAISQIGKVLTLLHKNGYVFGDLRLPNVLLDAKDEVKFIDFDWCGEYDRNIDDADDKIEHFEHVHGGDGPYARYPLEMSTVPGLWATGMQAFAEIRPKHDWEMLDKLKSN
jgi:hypothetical protein